MRYVVAMVAMLALGCAGRTDALVPYCESESAGVPLATCGEDTVVTCVRSDREWPECERDGTCAGADDLSLPRCDDEGFVFCENAEHEVACAQLTPPDGD